jgi:hypothetical protein
MQFTSKEMLILKNLPQTHNLQKVIHLLFTPQKWPGPNGLPLEFYSKIDVEDVHNQLL